MKRSVSFSIITVFSLAVVIGALLLMLPFATEKGSISFENALFTSVSAVTVTGLIVVDTATYFTPFGQTVILLLLQLGGLGFMTFSTLVILFVSKSISLKEKFIIENDFTSGNYKSIKDLVKKIFLTTLGFEVLGAVALFLTFSDMNLTKRLFFSTFHSVSAFCNAGFSLFSNSFENYASNYGINSILVVLIIAGGLGFLVLNELFLLLSRKIKKFSKISLHSKLVLVSSAVLTFAGFAVIFVEELLNRTNNLDVSANLITSFFQSVTARTAGFNTINLNILSYASIFILLFLMFVGASPGSTGGGVKTTTIGMVIAYFRSRLRGSGKTYLFYRNIPTQTIEKAFMVIILSSILVMVSFLLLLTFEKGNRIIDLLFETISAFGTVGLSLGVTAKLTIQSKIILSITMFIGRIGPLTLFAALSRRESKAVYNYPEENIMIG